MSLADSLPMFSDTLLTGLVWFLLLSVVLYLTRAPAHRAIVTLCRVLNEAMQLASGSILGAEKRLAERNRDVLLAVGREASQRGIEREFERVEVNVQREIAQCTAIDRLMNESLTKIEEDHKQSMEVPPAPPGWAGVVQAIAEVPGKSDPIVSGILEQIHTSLVKMQEQAINAYRSATQERHAHLKKMAPEWRSLGQLAAQMKKNVTTMIERSQTIDHKMDEYENIVRKSEQAERTLTASSLSQFFVSGLVLAIAIGGAFINFQLIARPMAEAVGANSFVGDLKIAEIAAMVHEVGGLVCVDGVAYAPHGSVDVKALNVDFYLFSLYKTYGPHLGVMHGKKDLLLEAKGQYFFFHGEDDLPAKMNPGAPNHELTAGCVGIGDYFEALAAHHLEEPANDLHGRMRQMFGIMAVHEENLSAKFLAFAANHPKIRLIGRATPEHDMRAPTFSFTIEGVKSQDVPALLEAKGLAANAGDFYAPRVLKAVGIDPDDGAIRCSFVHYNTLDEVDRLIAALTEIAG